MSEQSFLLNLQEDTDEIMGLNPEADANALLPPVPAGEYLARLTFTNPDEDFKNAEGNIENKRWGTRTWGAKQPQKVLVTSITATLYNTEGGLYDGRQVRDGLVSTMIQNQTGTCRMQGVIQCVQGVFPPTCKTRPQFYQLMNEVIGENGDATGWVVIDWEASESLTEEERDKLKEAGKKPFRVRGMKNFPQAKDEKGQIIPGVYVPEVSHGGETYRAYNVIQRYLTAEGDGQQHQIQEQAPIVIPPQNARQAQRPATSRVAPQQAQQQTQQQQEQATTATASQAPNGPPVPPRAATAAPTASTGAPTAPRLPQSSRAPVRPR